MAGRSQIFYIHLVGDLVALEIGGDTWRRGGVRASYRQPFTNIAMNAPSDLILPNIALPDNAEKLLLHCCCAPCSGAIIERLLSSAISVSVYFYNPNIHPRSEYETRKAEVKRFSDKMRVEFFDDDYDTTEWFSRIMGLENEPERGARCRACFDLRLERAALRAREKGFALFSSSLGISRRKNIEQVNAAGRLAASRHEGIEYWDFNWRKQAGAERAAELAKQEGFYRQTYCGCVFSMRSVRIEEPLKSPNKQ